MKRKPVFQLDKATHAERRKFIRDKHEHGGNFKIDVKTRKLYGAVKDESKKYNRIEMTRGLVDWHSHPMFCKNDDMCALGCPSPDDITNIVNGSLYGNLGHMVYSREGTYFIQVPEKLREKLRCDYAVLQKYLKDLHCVSDTIHENFLKRKFPYKDYIRYWLRAMTICGLTVKLFRGNTMPKFGLDIQAGDNVARAGNGVTVKYRVISVPNDIEHDPARLKVCKLRAG